MASLNSALEKLKKKKTTLGRGRPAVLKGQETRIFILHVSNFIPQRQREEETFLALGD
jgi:hypothetical protein